MSRSVLRSMRPSIWFPRSIISFRRRGALWVLRLLPIRCPCWWVGTPVFRDYGFFQLSLAIILVGLRGGCSRCKGCLLLASMSGVLPALLYLFRYDFLF